MFHLSPVIFRTMSHSASMSSFACYPTRWLIFIAFVLLNLDLNPVHGREENLSINFMNECGSLVEMDSEVSKYNVYLNLHPFSCLTNNRGFDCSETFRTKDDFAMVGSRLCVDVRGIPDDIHGECQLKHITADNSNVIKSLYCISRVGPSYKVCAQQSKRVISVSLSTKSVTKVCPTIMEFLFNHKIRMGTVSIEPVLPIYRVDMSSCTSWGFPDTSNVVVFKVNAERSRSECIIRKPIQTVKKIRKGCLKLVYLSRNYSCDIQVVFSVSGASVTLLPRKGQFTGHEECMEFADTYESPSLLFKQYQPYITCWGKFAVQLTYMTKSEDTKSEVDSKSPRVYMAVFVCLSLVCLLCLGLTCFCIRYRSRRLRHARRRDNTEVPAQNLGFLDPTAPPNSTNMSVWCQTNSGGLVGLPSYQEVTGERPGGANPSNKDELPPSYDSLCFAESQQGQSSPSR